MTFQHEYADLLLQARCKSDPPSVQTHQPRIFPSSYSPLSTPPWNLTLLRSLIAHVRLPDTYPALVAQARTAFHLPPHSTLQITTDVLDVCRGAPVRITEDVYGLLRGMLDYIRVEVAEEDDGEGGNQNKRQQEKGNGGEIHDGHKVKRGEGGECLEDGLDFVDVFSADGDQSSVVSNSALTKQPSQDTRALQTKPTTQKPRARLPPTAVPTASNSAPLPLQPPPPVASKEVDPEDPCFIVFISGPNTTHQTLFMVRKKDRISKVLSDACWHFGVDASLAQLVMRNDDDLLFPPHMTMEDCGAGKWTHFAVGMSM
ncbi:hypothetical protein BD779DRAFT_1802023 [Infundibulicybe gibba]|nr:hypothetical protein BD779DRAFT_1802023 [Infundibulicybe gibba]